MLKRSVVIALIGCGIDSSKAVKGMNPDIDIDADVNIRTLAISVDVVVQVTGGRSRSRASTNYAYEPSSLKSF